MRTGLAAMLTLAFALAMPGLAQRGGGGRGGAGRGAAPAKPVPPPDPTPRWPDGKVNLGSVPGHKGYWEVRPGLGGMPRAADVPFQPWARALYQYRTSKADLYPPLVSCKGGGGPSFFNAPGFEIVDAPELKEVFLLDI